MNEQYLRRAIALASHNAESGRGGPFGAVIVQGDVIIAEGVNCVTESNDPTAHAEVAAIRAACRKLSRFDLRGCAIYASCEPCPMCLAAIYWARLDEIVFAATREDASAAGFDDSAIYDEIPRPAESRTIPTRNLLRDEARTALEAWRHNPRRVPY
jgi:guanine deaminase